MSKELWTRSWETCLWWIPPPRTKDSPGEYHVIRVHDRMLPVSKPRCGGMRTLRRTDGDADGEDSLTLATARRPRALNLSYAMATPYYSMLHRVIGFVRVRSSTDFRLVYWLRRCEYLAGNNLCDWTTKPP